MSKALRLNKYKLCGQMSVGYDRICPMTLDIYEVDYSVSPGGINMYEVYDESGEYITDFDNMIDAHKWCVSMEEDYTFHLIPAH